MAQGKSRRESPELAKARWEQVRMVQEVHHNFQDFLVYGMDLLGFPTVPIQRDIGEFIEHGGDDIMVMAQRSQAKTTIAALYVAWLIIHNPAIRILLVMARGGAAASTAKLIIDIFNTLPELSCFLPDKLAGDTTATDNWQVHHSLKGLDKSPTIGSMSVKATSQGRRADFILIDDAESSRLSKTAQTRAELLNDIRDAYAICLGKKLWLGTPQSLDSIYFDQAKKGTVCRIWPGRYPSPEERKFYGDMLAPFIAERVDADPSLGTGHGLDGRRGAVTCPEYLGEEVHLANELAMGAGAYELQYMLNATLTDANRRPLSSSRVIVVPKADKYPLSVVKGVGPGFTYKHNVVTRQLEFGLPQEASPERVKPIVKAYIDPSGGGTVSQDGTGFAVAGLVGGNIVVLAAGSLPGGFERDKLVRLSDLILSYDPTVLGIEKNFGNGLFREVFQPVFREREAALKKTQQCGLLDDLVKGQKEVRIIERLEPVLGRGALWVTDDCLAQEATHLVGFPVGAAGNYSTWAQLNSITRTKGCLQHDDALDSLASVVGMFSDELAIDSAKLEAKAAEQRLWAIEAELMAEEGVSPARKTNTFVRRKWT